jgi:hypothetical protein
MTDRPDSRLVQILAVAGGIVFALLVVVVFIWLGDDGNGAAVTTSTAAGTTTTTSGTATTTTGTTTAGPTTTAASTTTGVSTTTIPFEGDVITQTNQTTTGDPGPNLTDVRVGDHPDEGFVRVVFDLTGSGEPYFIVGYEAGPFMETSGDTVPVEGGAFLVVRFSPARIVDIETLEPTYTGDEELHPGFDPIVEIQFIDDFEAMMTWVIGLTAQRPFTVAIFQGDSAGGPGLRLVVDIAK